MSEVRPDIFSSAAASIGVVIGEKERSLFQIYYEELLLWNERINLVSIKSPVDIWIKHFIDSLTALPFITVPTGRLLDIGSGAGFPGIPLKIAMNSLEIFLLEASRKRVSFQKHICRRLHLEGIHVMHKRLEELMKDDAYLHTFDMVISRASFKLPQLVTISSPLLTKNGVLIAMKGKEITDELEASLEAAKSADMIFCDSHDLTLPTTNDNRKIIIYKRNLQ
jgi:16S rRNA (guanine527-N7)-methyltransferase